MSIKYNERNWVDGVCTVTPATIAVNRVLWVEYETHRIMSDVWDSLPTAHYIDEDGREASKVVGGDGEYLVEATVDATEDAYSDFYTYRLARLIEDNTHKAEADARVIRKGDLVKVVSGRTGKGSVGKVVVVMNGTYGMGYHSVGMQKFGIALSDRMGPVTLKSGTVIQSHLDMVWVWEKNCEKAEVLPVDAEYIRGISDRQAQKETIELRARAACLNARKASRAA